MRSTVFLAHAAADGEYARELAAFLELGCDVRCDPALGLMGAGQDLIDMAEQSSGHLVLLLSKDSWPQRLPRERWDPLVLELPLACVLLNDCPFPELFRRRIFFDQRQSNAGRGIKRWLWQQMRDPGNPARLQWSEDLKELYVGLADQPGMQSAAPALARRFAEEAAAEFDCVFWIPCHGKSLVECTGELGTQLGMQMDETEKENRRHILEMLAIRRCLLVLDGPAEEVRVALRSFGRSSTLVTTEPLEIRETPRSLSYALQLVRAKRLAEAYELLYALLEEEVEPGPCAYELAWICEHWGRTAEAERLRQYDRMPSRQMGLFE